MDELARTCERIASWSSRLRKVALLAQYLKPLSDPDIARAVRFLCCNPVPTLGGKFPLAAATLRQAALAATGLDPDVYRVCCEQVGDTGETISLLLHGRTANEPLSLAGAELLYARLYKMRRTADKVELLREIFLRHRPLTLKFFIKVITGNLRIGLLAKQVEDAIAAAASMPPDEIRAAANTVGDLSAVALAHREGRLQQLAPRLFHPIDFMLAKPLDDLAGLRDPENYLVEDKYDGYRAQAHVAHGRVALYTRGMADVTREFPEIVSALKRLEPVVLDGEILAWRDGRPLSFNALERRKTEDVGVVFLACDVLYARGRMLFDTPVEERRAILESLGVGCAPQSAAVDLEAAFQAARERGNEGLIFKRRGSGYEPGKRSGAWLKVKRPYATLDVVITAAEAGHGRRAIWLSDYTFGVRDGERFVNVGKAYAGLSDEEIRELTRILRSAATDRFGRVVLVKPVVVLEVAFDLIRKSSRHKGGYALRFPRILRWRRDKKPQEADTLDRVSELYEASL